MFKNLKKDSINESFLEGVTFKHKKKNIYLVPVGLWILRNDKLLKLINKKRRLSNKFFMNDISKNLVKTKNFFRGILSNKNMCLFLICSKQKSFKGLIGLNYVNQKIEIYFVLKLRKNSFMRVSLRNLINFSSNRSTIKKFIVKVLSNNKRAKRLYHKLGFKNYKRYYLRKVKKNGLNSHSVCLKKLANVNYFYETLKFTI